MGLRDSWKIDTTDSFALDFSQFGALLETSYNAQVTSDRGFKKYVIPSMYNYYCAVTLWKRVMYVVSQHGPLGDEYEKVARHLQFATPVLEDVGVYLNSIGDCIDFTSSHFEFSLPYYFEALAVDGVTGTFDRVSPETAIKYETHPSLFVFLARILADVRYTNRTGPQHWDLPPALRPEDQNATLPNANLLGWAPAESLSEDQLSALEGAFIRDDGIRVSNIGNIPINQALMRYVGGMIINSKCNIST